MTLETSLEAAGLVQFSRFYIDHGIRSAGQLLTLRKNEIAEFAFPINTTLHFAVREIGEIGLPQEDELFTNSGRRILTNFVFRYRHNDIVGGPIKLPREFNKELNKFLDRNKHFKFFQRSKSTIDVQTVPYIISYSSIDLTYKYNPVEGNDYWRRLNFFRTVIDGVNEQLATTTRNQMLYFDVPNTLPNINRLMDAEAQLLKNQGKQLPLDHRLRMMLGSDGAYLILEFWLWAGENPHLSVFSRIPSDKLDKVSFITSLDGRYSVLNLGTFHSWIRTKANPRGALAPDRAQRAIFRHFMAIQQIRSVSDDTIIVDVESELEKRELDKQYGIKNDRMTLSEAVGNDREYVTEQPADPKLEVNIDATKYATGKTLNIDAKALSVAEDVIGGNPSDVEDFLFDQMDRDIQQHSITAAQNEVDLLETSEGVYKVYEAKDNGMEGKIAELADDLSAKGLYSGAEVRRVIGLSQRYKKIKCPLDESQTLEQYMKIDPESLKIADNKKLTEKPIRGIIDDSMLNYSIQDFDSRYINEIIGKDTVNAFMHFQRAGIAVTDLSMTRVDDYLGSYQIYSLQLTPVIGKASTVKIKIPVIDQNGIFVANKVKYKMKKQRRDLPIRKVTESSVALTSYMSKMFVNRTSRVRYNYGTWLVNQINLMGMDPKSGLSEIRQGNVFDPTSKLPISYTSIARQITRFKYGESVFHFDYKNLDKNFPSEVLSKIDLVKYVPIAVQQKETGIQVLAFDRNDMVVLIDLARGTIGVVGKITELLGIPRDAEPVNFAEVVVMGFDIPIGILLAYQIGLGNLLKTSGVEYRRAKRGSAHVLEKDEFDVIFEDEILIFKRDDQKACLIFNGFNRLKTTIRRVSVYSLDKQESFATLVKALGIPLNHLKQYGNIFDVWIDHIAREILIEMEEPTDMVLLFLSAVNKLCDDSYVDPNGVNEALLMGYQRIPGMVYDALYKALRQYTNNPMSKNAAIELNPKAVWFSITQDQTVAPIEESNPIHAIKEKEVLVFRGAGGRSADTMTAKHRQYVEDSIGIISEANVDNGQVGTIAYLTADPNIKSLRGVTRAVGDLSAVPRTKVQSTAMLLSPGSDKDDSKRVTFTNVMFTSTTFLYNATPNRVLSGAERTIAFRTDDIWARNAKKAGKITEVAKDSITVEYTDGKTESFPIGRYFGTWSGTIIPHDIKTDLKVGDVFDVDDILAYNSNYFQPDSLNPRHVIFKRGIRGNILFWETTDTLEDADCISKAFSMKLSTGMTEKRPVKVAADYEVELLKVEGDEVDPETILCTLRPPLSGLSSRYNSDALDALDTLSTLVPTAKHNGVIERIEVMYTGELENMSESVQELVTRYDSKLYRLNKKLNIPVRAARVDPTYAINNVDIGENQIVIMYYITENVGAGIGDKLVFGNQMKSIISNVVDEPFVAEDGTVVDVCFSRQSISNRIVNSMDIQGTSNTVLKLIEEGMINLYMNKT